MAANTPKIIPYILGFILAWIGITSMIQGIKNDHLTQSQLFKKIPESIILDFNDESLVELAYNDGNFEFIKTNRFPPIRDFNTLHIFHDTDSSSSAIIIPLKNVNHYKIVPSDTHWREFVNKDTSYFVFENKGTVTFKKLGLKNTYFSGNIGLNSGVKWLIISKLEHKFYRINRNLDKWLFPDGGLEHSNDGIKWKI